MAIQRSTLKQVPNKAQWKLQHNLISKIGPNFVCDFKKNTAVHFILVNLIFLQICLAKKRNIELDFNGIVKFYCWILIFSETIIFSKSHLWDQTGQLLFNITILRTSYVITKLNCMIQMLQKWIHVQAKCCLSLSHIISLSLTHKPTVFLSLMLILFLTL